jgi:acetylornithine deacetylase
MSDASAVMPQVVELLRSLVAFPTVSRTPNTALQEWLGEQLEACGARVQVVPGVHAGNANLVASLGPAVPGGLLLSGHTDVVPPGEGWRTDPFTLTALDDRLYGRGTADMKGFFAAVLVAMRTTDPATLHAPVHVLASYDEEVGCQGVRDVLPQLAVDPTIRPALVVIGEPTMMRPRHSHLGKQMYRVVVRAAEAHSSRAATAPSAIAGAAHLVEVLSAIQTGCPAARGDDAPAYTVNCGTIHGGTAANVIAAECEVVFEVRHDTHHDPVVVLAPFFAAADALHARLAAVGGGVDCHLVTSYPAMSSDTSSPAFAQAVRLADAGTSVALGFGTEGGLLSAVVDAPVMICGPGDIGDAHRPDEWVAVDQLERCVHVVRHLITAFCCEAN